MEFKNLQVLVPVFSTYTIIAASSVYVCIRLRDENAIKKRGLHLIIIQAVAMYLLASLNLIGNGPFFEFSIDPETDTAAEKEEIQDGDLWGYRIYTCLVVEAFYYLLWPPLWICKSLIAAALFKHYWATAFKIEVLHRSQDMNSKNVFDEMNVFQRAIFRGLKFIARRAGDEEARSDQSVLSPITTNMLAKNPGAPGEMFTKSSDSNEEKSAYVRKIAFNHQGRFFVGSAILAMFAFLITLFTSKVNYLHHSREDEVYMCPIEDNWYLFLNQALWLLMLPFMLKLLSNMREPYLIREELVIYAFLSVTFSILFVIHYKREPRLIAYEYSQLIYTGIIHILELIVSVTLPAAMGVRAVLQRRRQLSRPRGNIDGFKLLMKDHRLWEDFKNTDLAKGFALENAFFVEEFQEWKIYCDTYRYDDRGSLVRSRSMKGWSFHGSNHGNDQQKGPKSPTSPAQTWLAKFHFGSPNAKGGLDEIEITPQSPTTLASPTSVSKLLLSEMSPGSSSDVVAAKGPPETVKSPKSPGGQSKNWLTKFNLGSTTDLALSKGRTVMKCAVEQLNRRYILPDSVHELNIPAKIREGIQTRIRNHDYDLAMFKPVYDEVVRLMYLTYYPNFMKRHCGDACAGQR